MSEAVAEEVVSTPMEDKAAEIAAALGITPEEVLNPTLSTKHVPDIMDKAPESPEEEELDGDETDEEGQKAEEDVGEDEEEGDGEGEGGEDPSKALMVEMGKLREEMEQMKKATEEEEIVKEEKPGGVDFKIEPLPMPTFLDPNKDVEDYMTPDGLKALAETIYLRAKEDAQKEIVGALPQTMRAIAAQTGEALLTSRDTATSEIQGFYGVHAKEFQDDAVHDLFMKEVAVVQSQHPGWSAKDRLEEGYKRYSAASAAYAKVHSGKGGKKESGPSSVSTPSSSRPARRGKQKLTGDDAKQAEINAIMGAPPGFGIKGRRR